MRQQSLSTALTASQLFWPVGSPVPLPAEVGHSGDRLKLEEPGDVVERREDEDGDDVHLQGDVVPKAEEGDANRNVSENELEEIWE